MGNSAAKLAPTMARKERAPALPPKTLATEDVEPSIVGGSLTSATNRSADGYLSSESSHSSPNTHERVLDTQDPSDEYIPGVSRMSFEDDKHQHSQSDKSETDDNDDAEDADEYAHPASSVRSVDSQYKEAVEGWQDSPPEPAEEDVLHESELDRIPDSPAIDSLSSSPRDDVDYSFPVLNSEDHPHFGFHIEPIHADADAPDEALNVAPFEGHEMGAFALKTEVPPSKKSPPLVLANPDSRDNQDEFRRLAVVNSSGEAVRHVKSLQEQKRQAAADFRRRHNSQPATQQMRPLTSINVASSQSSIASSPNSPTGSFSPRRSSSSRSRSSFYIDPSGSPTSPQYSLDSPGRRSVSMYPMNAPPVPSLRSRKSSNAPSIRNDERGIAAGIIDPSKRPKSVYASHVGSASTPALAEGMPSPLLFQDMPPLPHSASHNNLVAQGTYDDDSSGDELDLRTVRHRLEEPSILLKQPTLPSVDLPSEDESDDEGHEKLKAKRMTLLEGLVEGGSSSPVAVDGTEEQERQLASTARGGKKVDKKKLAKKHIPRKDQREMAMREHRRKMQEQRMLAAMTASDPRSSSLIGLEPGMGANRLSVVPWVNGAAGNDNHQQVIRGPGGAHGNHGYGDGRNFGYHAGVDAQKVGFIADGTDAAMQPSMSSAFPEQLYVEPISPQAQQRMQRHRPRGSSATLEDVAAALRVPRGFDGDRIMAEEEQRMQCEADIGGMLSTQRRGVAGVAE